jgi:DNA-binding transcriptional MerR regulator
MIERLAFIRRGQAAAMSLSQIRQVLEIGDSGAAPCRHVTELIDARLREVEERLEELEATRALLQELARRAGAQDPAACEGFCSILSPASSGRPGWSGPRSRGS